jgi:hypothetical protein
MSLCPSLPTSPSCSDRGTCIALDTCDCGTDSGWIGENDMTDGSPSCSVYAPAIQGLYAVEAIATLGTQFPIAFLALLQKRRRNRSLYFQAPHFFAAINGITLGIGGILRAVRPRAVIGTDVAVTIFWSLSWTLAIVYGYFFTSVFLGMSQKLMSHTPQLRRKIDQFQVAYPYALGLIFLTAPLLFLIMLGFHDDKVAFLQLSQAYWLGSGFSVFFFFQTVVVLAFNPIVREIGSVIKHTSDVGGSKTSTSELAKTLRKVSFLRVAFSAQGTVVLLVGALFAFVPLLQRAGGSYYQPMIMMSWANIVVIFEAALLSTRDLEEGFPGPLRWLLSFGAGGTDDTTTTSQNETAKSMNSSQNNKGTSDNEYHKSSKKVVGVEGVVAVVGDAG